MSTILLFNSDREEFDRVPVDDKIICIMMAVVNWYNSRFVGDRGGKLEG